MTMLPVIRQGFARWSAVASVATIIFFSLNSRLHAQEATLQHILPEPAAAQACMDTPPLNNGWGWNGHCTCPTVSGDLGMDIKTNETILAATTHSSPQNCRGSGSITVFKIQEDGSLQKEAELVPSRADSDDGFAFSSTSFAVSDNLVAGATRSEQGEAELTVFEKVDEAWLEVSTFNVPDQPDDLLFSGDTLLVQKREQLHGYDFRTGTLIQTLSYTPSFNGCTRFNGWTDGSHSAQTGAEKYESPRDEWRLRENFAVGVAVYGCEESKEFELAISIYNKSDVGTYEQNIVFDTINAEGGEVYSYGVSESIVWIRLVDEGTLVETLITFYRAKDGNWQQVIQEGEGLVKTDVPNPIGLAANSTFFFILPQAFAVDYQMLQFDTSPPTIGETQPLYFHQFSSEAGWSVANTVEIQSPNSYNSLALSDKQIAIMNHDFHLDGRLTLLKQGNEGNWNSSMTLTFPMSGYIPMWGSRIQVTENNVFLNLRDNGFLNIIVNGNEGSAQSCVDPDGDGWGWNGMASCQVDGDSTSGETSECIDSDGDGWGWDGMGSCRITTETAGDCIDSDGDGWGWNDATKTSCNLMLDEPPAVSESCDYGNADVYNGWGWDPIAGVSCIPLDSAD